MNWRGAFLDNVGFKVAALVVVAMLWISVTADERQAQPVSTRVSVDVRDSSWVLMEHPAEVSTTFQGRTRELLGLVLDRPTVRIEVDSVTGERMRVALPLDRVEYDRDLGPVPSFINPPAIDLRFERRTSARVPVRMEVDPVPAPGYAVMGDVSVEPESVTVRGPASWIERLTGLPTRALRLEGLENTVIRDVPLDLPEDVPGASADPAAVLVTVTLDSLVVRELRVPVRLTGDAAASARVEPDSVTVSLRGGAAAVERWSAEFPPLDVEVSTPPTGPREVTLATTVDPDDPIAVRLEPETVSIEPRT